MVTLQLWTRNLKYAHFGKARQCLIELKTVHPSCKYMQAVAHYNVANDAIELQRRALRF